MKKGMMTLALLGTMILVACGGGDNNIKPIEPPNQENVEQVLGTSLGLQTISINNSTVKLPVIQTESGYKVVLGDILLPQDKIQALGAWVEQKNKLKVVTVGNQKKYDLPFYTAEYSSPQKIEELRNMLASEGFGNRFNVRMVETPPSDRPYIQLVNGNGSAANLGLQPSGKPTMIMLDSTASAGVFMHEFFHALLGAAHAQTDSSCKNVIKINWENIDPDNRYNFEEWPWAPGQSTSGSCSKDSIMMYPKTAFSINGKNTLDGPIVYQRFYLTADDKKLLNDKYPELNSSVQCVVESVSITPTTTTLEYGKTLQLTATPVIGPSGCVGNPDTTVKWTSSDPTILTVDNLGKVVTKWFGNADITATIGSIAGKTNIIIPDNTIAMNSVNRFQLQITTDQGCVRVEKVDIDGIHSYCRISDSQIKNGYKIIVKNPFDRPVKTGKLLFKHGTPSNNFDTFAERYVFMPGDNFIYYIDSSNSLDISNIAYLRIVDLSTQNEIGVVFAK